MKVFCERLYWRVRNFISRFKEFSGKFIGLTLNIHIPTKRPPLPAKFCGVCSESYTRIIAIETGDGWSMDWECENECGWTEPIVGWWPFWFDAWAGPKDFRKIGIEVA